MFVFFQRVFCIESMNLNDVQTVRKVNSDKTGTQFEIIMKKSKRHIFVRICLICFTTKEYDDVVYRVNLGICLICFTTEGYDDIVYRVKLGICLICFTTVAYDDIVYRVKLGICLICFTTEAYDDIVY